MTRPDARKACMQPTCPLCVGSDDELTGYHDPNCPILMAEDDQLRAHLADLADEPIDPALLELALDRVALVLYQARLRRVLA
jgi:hypothetical protein